jgi:AraC-like DNA-binding protein
MKYNTLHKVTSLNAQDCLLCFSSVKKALDHPLHYHAEYELHLILNAAGATRIVGDHEAVISDPELVLTGPDLPHSWKSPATARCSVTEITIQFPGDLFAEEFLGKNQLSHINKLLQSAQRGVSFSRQTIEKVQSDIFSLKEKKGFGSFLGLLSILHTLSAATDSQILSTEVFVPEPSSNGSRQIDSVYAYMKANYSRSITLEEVAKRACMTKGAFCRFILKRTGKTYMESLNEIRIGHISRMLLVTSEDIAEIAYKTGYNNVAHFNRSFKRLKGCTPKEFRESHSGKRGSF